MSKLEPTPFNWGGKKWKARVPTACAGLFGSHLGRFKLAGTRWAGDLTELGDLTSDADLPPGSHLSGNTLCMGENVIGWLLPLDY